MVVFLFAVLDQIRLPKNEGILVPFSCEQVKKSL